MSLDTSKAIAKLRSLTTKFDSRVKAVTPWYPKLCTVVPSDGYDEEYGLLGSMPGVRERVGDRVWEELRAAKFSIVNKDWESGIKIKKNDLDDDRMGIYGPLLEQLAIEAACHPDELLLGTVLTAGAASACYDGQYFYDTDHVWGKSGTQSNALTYNANDHTAVTPAEFRAAYHQARRKMMRYKNDAGKPLNRAVGAGMKNLVLTVPPELEEAAVTGLTAAFVGGGDSNVVLDMPEIVAVNYFESTVKFQLHFVGGVLKPFIFQPRKPLNRWTKGYEDPEADEVKFGTDARYNLGYGAWWTSVETTFN